jgi:hypothetical protein
MGNEIELKGSHGTSISKARVIQKEGFKVSRGRLGIGVYFWRNNAYAEYLAESWWEFEFSKGKFKRDQNQGCSVIWANFKIEDNDFLDLNDKDINDGLAKFCIEKKLSFSNATREMASLITAYISRLENKLNHSFKVIESTVSTAPREFINKYPLAVLGSPSCYIVFNTECISIYKVEICN